MTIVRQSAKPIEQAFVYTQLLYLFICFCFDWVTSVTTPQPIDF